MEQGHGALPDEMVEEIILRLPPKEVGKLRLLSTLWNSRLSSPGFVRAHSKFHMNRNVPEIIIYATFYDPLVIIPVAGGYLKPVSSPLFGNPMHTSAEASCYGFVVVEIETEKGKGKSMFLFNLTTKEAIEIPPFKSLTPNERKYFLGLGYDGSSDDYKVVRLSSSRDYDETFVDVYSFKMKAWKNLGMSRYCIDDCSNGVLINGCLHWRAYDHPCIIVAFDLANEEFKEVPSPKVSGDDSFEGDSDDSFEEAFDFDDRFRQGFKGFDHEGEVTVFGGGCLAVMTNPSGKNYIEIWVMKEYGVQKSWKLLVIPNELRMDLDDDVYYDDLGIFRFVCLSGNDKLIFRKYSREYNLSTGRWKDVLLCDCGHDYIAVEPNARVVTFRECLVSPNLL